MSRPIIQAPSLSRTVALLAANDLPTDDIDEGSLGDFLGCGDRFEPDGVVGLQVLGESGLLRSLAVDESVRGQGCGKALVAAVEELARRRGLGRLYLLTNTAETFFLRLGYVTLERHAAPPEVRRTREYGELCPESAVLMTKSL